MDQIIASKYRVERELGQGGYGKVLLVRHVDIGVQYALKVLSRLPSSEGDFIERFKREAEALARFAHPRVAQLRDFGTTNDGVYYMALDYCAGEPLQVLLERESWLPVKSALKIAVQILETLQAAHAAQVVHRDIKPANVLINWTVEEEPEVYVLDFGIAKICQDNDQNQKVTREGATIGTPQYMSPEQASGIADLDHRVDLYSVGVLLYELVTGGVPFNGETVLQTLIKHLTQPPPPFAAKLGLPIEVENLVMKAMEKDREDRFQSATEFKEACEALLWRFKDSAHAKSAQADTSPIEPEPPPAPNNGETQILCLDDNEMILNITKHIFENDGFQVHTANNFSVIHDYIFKHNVKLMLCDVEMPGLPGTTICKMLKSTVKDLKIILFSNVPERELEQLSYESKADGWIFKGEKPETWLAKVREYL